MRASRGQGYDLVTPGLAWVSAGVDFDLYQPLEIKRVKNFGNYRPEFRRACRASRRSARRQDLRRSLLSTEAPPAPRACRSRQGRLPTEFSGMRNTGQGRGAAGRFSSRPGYGWSGPARWSRAQCCAPSTTRADEESHGQTLASPSANKAQIKQFWLKGGEQKAAFLQMAAVVGMTWTICLG